MHSCSKIHVLPYSSTMSMYYSSTYVKLPLFFSLNHRTFCRFIFHDFKHLFNISPLIQIITENNKDLIMNAFSMYQYNTAINAQ